MATLHPVVEAVTLGECWPGVSELILDLGVAAADANGKSASITTFEPLTDTAYIPCISLLDFGKKVYANMVELALLQAQVADAHGRDCGRLTVHVKSAHIDEPEYELIRQRVDARASLVAG